MIRIKLGHPHDLRSVTPMSYDMSTAPPPQADVNPDPGDVDPTPTTPEDLEN